MVNMSGSTDSNDRNQPEIQDELVPPADRRVTFRKRRLSLPMHHLSVGDLEEEAVSGAEDTWSLQQPPPAVKKTAESSSSSPQDNEKAHTFRKRRLSLNLSHPSSDNNNNNDDTAPHHGVNAYKRSRRGSDASGVSVASTVASNAPLRPKTMHSEELLSAGGVPASPAVHSGNILYTRQSFPPTLSLPLSAVAAGALLGPNGAASTKAGAFDPQPKWKKRHTVSSGDEHKLPFPRDMVGTYSCHGSEPVYDSSYEEYEEAEVEEYGTNADSWDVDGEVDDDEDEQVKPLSQNSKQIAGTNPAAAPAEKTITTTAKINQDRGGVVYPYGNNRRTALFAVYDGHGQGGELVSQYALHEIQRKLEKHPTFGSDIAKAFKDTFLEVDETLKHEPLIEPYFSGTTACVALLVDNKLTLANAGDSRAVLARREHGGSRTTLQAIDLTEDQNPDLPQEMQRIISAGGYVTPSPGPGLSARVWLDSMCTQIGLAMARSIGDHAVSAVGVIAEPVVTFHQVNENDEFMILASDGVWEFLNSQDAVKIVGDNLHRGATKACQALIEAAAAKWHEEEGDYRDDITAIVVRLQGLWNK